MTRIKICGITNVEDARAAVDYGTDALGFIFVPGTPRYVTPKTVVSIASEVGPFVHFVAVTRDCSDYMSAPKGIGAHQYYENFRHVFRGTSGVPSVSRIRALRVRDEEDLVGIDLRDHPQALLLDTYHKDKLGGSGETFNWDLAVESKERFGKPIILAGGLTHDNVGDAIARVRPYAVDVSSGVEAEPGRKDHAKLKAFIRAVREVDRLLES